MKRSGAAVRRCRRDARSSASFRTCPRFNCIADAALNAVRDAGISLSDIDNRHGRRNSPSRSRTIWASRQPGSMPLASVDAHSSCMFGTQRQQSKQAYAGPCSSPMAKADGPVSQLRDFPYRSEGACFSSSKLPTVPPARRQCSRSPCLDT